MLTTNEEIFSTFKIDNLNSNAIEIINFVYISYFHVVKLVVAWKIVSSFVIKRFLKFEEKYEIIFINIYHTIYCFISMLKFCYLSKEGRKWDTKIGFKMNIEFNYYIIINLTLHQKPVHTHVSRISSFRD